MFNFFGPKNSIKAEDFVDIMKDVEVLDVRGEDEIAQSERDYFKNYKVIPLPQLPYRLDELDNSKKYYIMCRSGARSQSASKILDKANIENVVVSGGIIGVIQNAR
ncbi:MAG: rhodanese-like domain-containing protein [Tissierellia bacterium]|nr:rhodanese-like domain-containing protein [Tissierellia bacterium]